MDKAKLRIIAGVGAGLFGFAGTTMLSVALVVWLTSIIGLGLATLTAGCLYLSVGLLFGWVFLSPTKSTDEEVDDLNDSAADFLSDLPFDTLKQIFEKRPVTAATAAAVVGYMIISNPRQTIKTARYLLPYVLVS